MSVNGLLNDLSLRIDNITGFRGSSGYILILLLVLIGYKVMNSSNEPTKVEEEEEEEKEIDPPRNFTQKQLIYFDGKKDEKTKEEKPVYLSVNGIVFDVSDGRSFYGPDGPYENFAGHECGVALAKMSFETEHLDDLKGCKDLNFGEKEELDGWVEKFTYYRHYPVKGRLIAEDDLNSLADRILTSDDLSKYTGDDGEEIPEGYAAPPIYIGAGDKVFDASFGGAEFYGAKGGYSRFAGRDISRALAKMSFSPEDLESSSVEDLDEKQKKILNDWVKTYEEKNAIQLLDDWAKQIMKNDELFVN